MIQYVVPESIHIFKEGILAKTPHNFGNSNFKFHSFCHFLVLENPANPAKSRKPSKIKPTTMPDFIIIIYFFLQNAQ